MLGLDAGVTQAIDSVWQRAVKTATLPEVDGLDTAASLVVREHLGRAEFWMLVPLPMMPSVVMTKLLWKASRQK